MAITPVLAPSIILSINSTTATIAFGLQRKGYSRAKLNFHEVKRTLNNRAVITNNRNESPLIWRLRFPAELATVEDIASIILQSEEGATPQIRITDLVNPIIDNPTLTRLTAPAPNNTVTTRPDGYKSHYALFDVVVGDADLYSDKIAQTATETWYNCALTLVEGNKTA